jgi:hypothetical protein
MDFLQDQKLARPARTPPGNRFAGQCAGSGARAQERRWSNGAECLRIYGRRVAGGLKTNFYDIFNGVV